ncbi:MAG: sugar-binding transcriptional regulator [Pseudomonadota bacterium]
MNAPYLPEDDTSMVTRAAWLHYAGGLTQSQVAKRLGLTSLKAHRLIARANQEGRIKVFIDGSVRQCTELEDEISGRYGLDYCEVVPAFDDSDLPLRALGRAGALYLKRAIDHGAHRLIGVGHGRTLAACIDYLPRTRASKTKFVSLLGGFSRRFAANPHDVIHRLAEKTDAQAFALPLPFYADSRKDREIMLSQKSVRDVLTMAQESSLKLAGIGNVDVDASTVDSGMIEAHEILAARKAGAIGELLGHFFDANGQLCHTPLSHRTMALEPDQWSDSKIVAVAGGKNKVAAIRAILTGRLLSGLLTDELSAKALIASSNGHHAHP